MKGIFVISVFLMVVTFFLGDSRYKALGEITTRNGNNWFWAETTYTNSYGKFCELQIFYIQGTDTTQYATLYIFSITPMESERDTSGGYFRMETGKDCAWGISIIVLPCFWGYKSKSNTVDSLYQGARLISCSGSTSDDTLLISYTAEYYPFKKDGTKRDTLYINNGLIKLFPPKNNTLSALVSYRVSGNFDLFDKGYHQNFQIVKLSSMRLFHHTEFDTDTAYVDNKPYPIPDSLWIIEPSEVKKGYIWGLNGAPHKWSEYDKYTPAIRITLGSTNSSFIQGWVTKSSNHDDDNVGYWAAEDSIVRNVKYQVIAKPWDKYSGFSKNTNSSIPYKSITCHPNPFKDRLFLDLPSPAGIYNIEGKLITILKAGRHSLDTREWQTGVYIIKIQSTGEIRKLVKFE